MSHKPKRFFAGLFTSLLLFSIMTGAKAEDYLCSEPLTLARSIELALANNKDMELSRWEADFARRQLEYEETVRPSVVLSGTVVSLTDTQLQFPSGQFQVRYDPVDDLKLEFNFPFSMMQERVSSRLQFSATYSTKLFATEPVVIGSDRPGHLETLRSTEMKLALSVADAYYTLLKRTHQVTLQEREYVLSVKKLEKARALGSENDILKADVQVDSTNVALDVAMESLELARTEFFELLGIPAVKEIQLDEKPTYQFEALDLEYLIKAGIACSTKVKEAQQKVDQAKMKLEDVISKHRWDVTLSAQYQWTSEPTNPHNQKNDEFKASVTVRRPLYPVAHLDIEEQEIALAKAQAALDKTIQQARRDVEIAYGKLESASEHIVSLEERIAESCETLERVVQRSEVGLVTDLDVMEVQNTMETATVDLTHALYDYHMVRWQLLALCDVLSIEDIL